jgi:predicted DNA-binding protein YlxM (UPF0122 family)
VGSLLLLNFLKGDIKMNSIIDEHLDEIKELYDCDVSIKDIASDFNIRQSTLSSYIRRHPELFPNRNRRYRHLSEEESKEIYQEWLKFDKSVIDIAKERNISEGTVRRHIHINLRAKKL